MAWVVVAASLLGLAINVYFLPHFFRLPRGVAEAISRAATACGIEGGACARVARTRYARLVFGLPNVVVGLPWSLLTLACGAVCVATGAFPLWWPCVLVGAASVAAGAYLTGVLLFVLKDP